MFNGLDPKRLEDGSKMLEEQGDDAWVGGTVGVAVYDAFSQDGVEEFRAVILDLVCAEF
jgi:hypothetical protein